MDSATPNTIAVPLPPPSISSHSLTHPLQLTLSLTHPLHHSPSLTLNSPSLTLHSPSASGVKATLTDGAYHDVDSSVMAFEIAGRQAARQGLRAAGAKLMEPMMKVGLALTLTRPLTRTRTRTQP